MSASTSSIATVKMSLRRTTKGSYLYEALDPRSEVIRNLYIRKEAFGTRVPQEVTVIVEVPGEGA